MMIYLAQKVQIDLLNIKEVLKSILSKYLDFVIIFLEKLVLEMFKYLNITKNATNLK